MCGDIRISRRSHYRSGALPEGFASIARQFSHGCRLAWLRYRSHHVGQGCCSNARDGSHTRLHLTAETKWAISVAPSAPPHVPLLVNCWYFDVYFFLFTNTAYRTVSGVNGPLVILDNVKVLGLPLRPRPPSATCTVSHVLYLTCTCTTLVLVLFCGH